MDRYYERNNQARPDSTLHHLAFHYRLAYLRNEPRQLLLALKRRENFLRLQGSYDLAMDAYQETDRGARHLFDPILQADITANMGKVFIYQKDYARATRFFSDALAIYQEFSQP
ncbi:MAG: hypothetical protein RLY31_2998 [Bacteroidota bacterium]